MTDKIKTILEQMTIEEKADMVCGASNFCTADASRYGVPAIRMLDGGTGINYEQLIADLILSWRTNPRDEEEAWLMKDFSATEERNVIFDYFRPDKLTEKETKVWKKVREYLKERDSDSAYLFVSRNGGKLDRSSVNRFFNQCSDRITPHKLRHYFCSHALEMGYTVAEVANQAGHASERTTLIYTNTSRKQMKEKSNLL